MQRRLAVGLAFLSVVVMCAALAQIVNTRVAAQTAAREARPTRVSLAAEPESQLQFPRSTEYAAGGHDAEWTLEVGSQAAVVWRRYGVDAAWEDVASYFADELTARGWREGGCASGNPSTRESDVVAWHTDDRILRVGNREDPPKDVGMIRTYYEVALLGKGVARVCADRERSPAPQISPSE
jgi:hypothetical protein